MSRGHRVGASQVCLAIFAIFTLPCSLAQADGNYRDRCRATGEPCFLGIDPDIYQMPLTGEYIQDGARRICATTSWSQLPPEAFNQPFLRGFWPTLNAGQQAATETAAYGFVTTHWGPPAAPAGDLRDVTTPSAFSGESFRALERRTTRVEFEVPKTDLERLGWQLTYLPIAIPPDPAPDSPIRLRGWYIRGDGLLPTGPPHSRGDRRSREHPLFILSSGFPYSIAFDEAVGAIEVGGQMRRTITYLVAKGYDVLIFDKRGHGYSEGLVDGKGEDIFRALDLLEKGRVTEEGITYKLSIITPEGRYLRGRAAAAEPLLGRRYQARTKPVVLRGFSYGSTQLQKAMAMNYSDLPVELRYRRDEQGNVVVDSARTPPGNRGYNFRGIVAISGFHGSLKYETVPYFLALDAAAAQVGHTGGVMPSTVYESMRHWPAYLGLFATNDFESADGAVDVYNNQLRGFKDIRLVTGYHFGLSSAEVDGYFASESTRFAEKAIFHSPPAANTATTTYAQVVCDAESVTMDPATQAITSVESRRIQKANREVDRAIASWMLREKKNAILPSYK